MITAKQLKKISFQTTWKKNSAFLETLFAGSNIGASKLLVKAELWFSILENLFLMSVRRKRSFSIHVPLFRAILILRLSVIIFFFCFVIKYSDNFANQLLSSPLFLQGIYFSESFRKSLDYSDYSYNSTSGFIFLCEVNMFLAFFLNFCLPFFAYFSYMLL